MFVHVTCTLFSTVKLAFSCEFYVVSSGTQRYGRWGFEVNGTSAWLGIKRENVMIIY